MNDLVGVRFQVDTSEAEKNFKKLFSSTNNLNNSMARTITGIDNTTQSFSKQNTEIRELENLYSLTGKELKKASEDWYLLSKETDVSSEKLEEQRKKINEARLAHQMMGETLENSKNKLKELKKESSGVNETLKMPNMELLNQKSFELARGFNHIGTTTQGTSADLINLKTNINILDGFVKTSENNLKNLTAEYSELSQKTGITNKDLENHRKKIAQATRNHTDMTSRLDYLNKKLGQSRTEVNNLSNSVEKSGNSFKATAAKITGYIGAAVGIREAINLGKKSIEVNSNMIETQNKFNVVYGEHSKAANNWVKNYSDVLGISRLKTKESMADIQNLFTGFGMDRKTSMDMSKDIVMLANDLDSFNNLSSRGIDVHKTMQSALMGESEAAKTLGASILEPQMNVAAMALGFKKYSNKMDETTKIMIRMKAIQMQSKDAIGDTARNLDTEVGKRRRLNKVTEDFQIMLGEKLMPLQLKYLDTGTKTIEFLTNNFDSIVNVSQALGVLGASYVAFKTGAVLMSGYQKVTTALSLAQQGQSIVTGILTLAQTKLNVAMAANPIGFVLAGITAVVGAGYLLYKNWETIKEKAYSLWDAMDNNPFGRAAKFIIQYLTPVGQLTTGIKKLYEWYKKFKGEGDLEKEAQITGVVDSPNLTPKPDGSHRNGLTSVPFDGYMAELHKGERVLTAEESKAYNSTINNNTINTSKINNINQKPQSNKITIQIDKIIENISIKDSSELDYKSIASKVVEHIIPKLEIALAEV